MFDAALPVFPHPLSDPVAGFKKLPGGIQGLVEARRRSDGDWEWVWRGGTDTQGVALATIEGVRWPLAPLITALSGV